MGEFEASNVPNLKQVKVSSTLLSFIADCCMKVQKIGMHHLYIKNCHLQASDRHRGIYINVDLPASDICEPEQFQLSIKASPENAKLLRSVGKRGGDVCVETLNGLYLFMDDYTEVQIREIDIKRAPTTITEFVSTLTPYGAAVPTIYSRSELCLSGNEQHVDLGVYGGQLSSLTIPNNTEQFFEPQVARQMKRQTKDTYKSYSFLKFGTQDFDVSLHAGSDHIWLLTEGQFSDAVTYRVLEKLISTTWVI